MEVQTPAEGVMIKKNHPDFKYYTIACECGCDNAVDVLIEVDDGIMSINVYSMTKTNYWRQVFDTSSNQPWLMYVIKSFANDVANRLIVAWQAIVHGYVKTEATTILSKQQAYNIGPMLEQAIKDCEEYDKARRNGKNLQS